MTFPTKSAAAAAGLKLIASYIVEGAAKQNIDFAGLDINKHKFYEIHIKKASVIADTHTLFIYINQDYTNTNYRTEHITASGGSLAPRQSNDSEFLSTFGDGRSSITVIKVMRDPTGYARAMATSFLNIGTILDIRIENIMKYNATVTNITDIRIASNKADALGVGTIIEIYGVA